jgi:ABC-type branched-subunit amino acid transport system permease subunit
LSFTGGTAGLPIPAPRIPGLNLAITQGKSYPTLIFGVLVLIVVILLGLLVARLRRGPAGRMLLAIRSNERAAGSVGINVAQGKLMAFGLAAFIAGVGGALTGYMQGELTADSFAAFTSIGLLAIVFVAGVGRISGAVVAGIMFSAAGLFVTFLNIHLNVGKYQAIVAGIALVLTAVQNPDGITSTSTGKGPAVALEKLRGRFAGEYQKRMADRGRAAVPEGANAGQAAVPGAGAVPGPGAGAVPAPGAGGSGSSVEGDEHDLHHPAV